MPAYRLRLKFETSNIFPEINVVTYVHGGWALLTNHARVLLHLAHDPGARLRDIAASLGIAQRRARGIITDLAKAGYVITQKDGRRNRYQI